jgi:hypothetical protein
VNPGPVLRERNGSGGSWRLSRIELWKQPPAEVDFQPIIQRHRDIGEDRSVAGVATVVVDDRGIRRQVRLDGLQRALPCADIGDAGKPVDPAEPGIGVQLLSQTR